MISMCVCVYLCISNTSIMMVMSCSSSMLAAKAMAPFALNSINGSRTTSKILSTSTAFRFIQQQFCIYIFCNNNFSGGKLQC